jgi:hypothetical protein
VPECGAGTSNGALGPLGLSSHEDKTGTSSEGICIVTLHNVAVVTSSVTDKRQSTFHTTKPSVALMLHCV